MRSLFSTAVVGQLTGASVRQIGYWAQTGLLRPSGKDASGRGSRRRYTFQDIVALQTIRKLRGANCPLQKIRAAVRYLARHMPASPTAAIARLTLLTDGERVYMLKDEREVMDVLTRQMVWSIPLGKLILDTQRRIGELPHEWTEKVQVRGRTYHLHVVQDQETDDFTVQCPELPGAIEQGRTRTEAIANGKDAIESVLRWLERRGRNSATGNAHVTTG